MKDRDWKAAPTSHDGIYLLGRAIRGSKVAPTDIDDGGVCLERLVKLKLGLIG